MKVSIALACLSAVAFAAPAARPAGELESRQYYYGAPPPKPTSIIKSIQNITTEATELDAAIVSIEASDPNVGVAATLDAYTAISEALGAQTAIVKKAAKINPRYIPLVQSYIDKLISAVQKASKDLNSKKQILADASYADLVPSLIYSLQILADTYADALISKVQNVGTDRALAKGDKARVDVALFNIFQVYGLYQA